ncbi:hypothetical protein [Taibaiella koreensis]|uniref:hypothetical protein n=1 Tax=Taibaiella koreensis TaxID=1268548 RepID=UPI000E59CD97|nr:hypothetical protein [Taibaiella koreensis]
MKNTFRNLVLGKKIDLSLQVLTFPVVLWLCKSSSLGPFALYIIGAVQTGSALLWTLYFRNSAPAYVSGAWIRGAFLILAPFLALMVLAGTDALLLMSCCMLVIGPVLGTTYFMITILEIRYYSKARKPYYLL